MIPDLEALTKKVLDEINIFQDELGWQEGESRNKLIGDIAWKMYQMILNDYAGYTIAPKDYVVVPREMLKRVHDELSDYSDMEADTYGHSSGSTHLTDDDWAILDKAMLAAAQGGEE